MPSGLSSPEIIIGKMVTITPRRYFSLALSYPWQALTLARYWSLGALGPSCNNILAADRRLLAQIKVNGVILHRGG